jgi:putative membrane protein
MKDQTGINLGGLQLEKNDRKAHILIWTLSAIVFVAVTVLDRVEVKLDLPFDPHIFAMLSALVNSAVAILLVVGLYFIKQKNIAKHKKTMLMTMALSVLFLVFYILHHLLTGETKFGDLDHNGSISDAESLAAGSIRYVYYFIISTHITLAGIIMPFVLYTAYRALIGEYQVHRKLARWTFPIWLYVAITGVIVYLMISPYYN